MNTGPPALSDGGTTMNFTLKGHILPHHRPVFDQILRKVANLISACIYTEHTCDFPHTFKTWVKEFDPLTINSLVLVQWGTLVAHLSLVSLSANFLSPLHLPIKCPKTTIKEGRLVIVIFLPLHLFLLPSHWPPVQWRPSCAWSADRRKHSWQTTPGFLTNELECELKVNCHLSHDERWFFFFFSPPCCEQTLSLWWGMLLSILLPNMYSWLPQLYMRRLFSKFGNISHWCVQMVAHSLPVPHQALTCVHHVIIWRRNKMTLYLSHNFHTALATKWLLVLL